MTVASALRRGATMSTATKPRAVKPETAGSTWKETEDSFLTAFLGRVDVVEKAGLSAMEVPLSVLSSLGMPDETTEKARQASHSMANVVFGTIDMIAAGSLKVADLGVALVTGVFSALKKSGPSAS
jgi:hypothetical protein